MSGLYCSLCREYGHTGSEATSMVVTYEDGMDSNPPIPGVYVEYRP